MDKLTSDEIFKVVNSLIGETDACGDSAVDRKNLNNLNTLIEVTDMCLDKIAHSALTSNSEYGSSREIGKTALKYLADSAEWFNGKKRQYDNENG